jgi:hypothetical protein
MGVGTLGEVRTGPDGALYQWVQGVDGLGNTVGFWKRLARIGRRVRGFVRRALPVVQRLAPLVPGGAAVTSAIQTATPVLKATGVLGLNGVGALYQAPDGSYYEVEGLAQEEEDLQGLGQEDLVQMMGVGTPGEVRGGPDGNLYQWVQGVDGLGNPAGFWRRLRRFGRKVKRFVKKAIPVVQAVAPFIPGGGVVTAALRTATPILKATGVLGTDGIGALYQAPDGTIYQSEGLGEEEDETAGTEGWSLSDQEEPVFQEGAPVAGLDQVYVPETAPDGTGAYVPEDQPATPADAGRSRDFWKPLW